MYLYSDRDKTKARPRYIVVAKNDDWCHIKKVVGSQLRSNSYRVKLSECYRVPCEAHIFPKPHPSHIYSDDAEDTIETFQSENAETHDVPEVGPVQPTIPEPVPVVVPDVLSAPLHPPEGAADVPDSDSNVENDCEQQRSQRNRKLPQYLQDYVMY